MAKIQYGVKPDIFKYAESSGEFHGLTAGQENLSSFLVFLFFTQLWFQDWNSPVQWAPGAENEGHSFPTTTSKN